MSRFFAEAWAYIFLVVDIGLAMAASAHVVLYKRDVRAAIGWTGLIWLAPLIGTFLYVVLGVNRIRRRAFRLREEVTATATHPAQALNGNTQCVDSVHGADVGVSSHLVILSRYVARVTKSPLVTGNSVRPLVNGDEAYPAMLEAIRGAQDSIALSTYIFDNDRAGHWFVDALAAAVRRGLQVRVLIDGVGARYSRPPVSSLLQAKGVRVARFLKSFIPWRNPYLNLRNHRKILVVDGRIGFTGGLNIREGCVLELNTEHAVQDVHFRFEGPVVAAFMDTFALDWVFTTGERLEGDMWYPGTSSPGCVTARTIPNGPDEDFESIRWTMLGALSKANRSVRITTPYFLPDQTLITALNLTAMRGVEVDIVIPERSNLRFVQWAAAAQAWQILTRGCRVWLSRPPFDHSKLFVVDAGWVFIGSANWDARSLRLNFEFNVECYDREFAASAERLIDAKIRNARRLTVDEVNGRSTPVKIRDGVARLFSPYL